jgi:hypothetical protein
MIKFFRKIRKRLLSENSFGRYLMYAIGEIVLVVIGILIALQINNWNEQKKKSAKEQLYLSGMKSDFEQTKRELHRVIQKTARIQKVSYNLLSLDKSSRESLPSSHIDSLIDNSTGYTIFMTSQATIRDLVGSGNLDLISNDTLRTYIASWDAGLKPIRGWEEHSKQSVTELSEILNEVTDNFGYAVQDKPLLSSSDRQDLLELPKFRNTLDDLNRYSDILNDLYNEMDKTVDAIISLVKREMKPPKNNP